MIGFELMSARQRRSGSGGCALQGDDLPEVADINGRGDQPMLSGHLQDPLRRVQKHLELPPPNPQSQVEQTARSRTLLARRRRLVTRKPLAALPSM